MLARAKASASTAAPRDEDLQTDYPCCWWALNQRKDDSGNRVPGATFTVLSDGPFYVVFLTLRQVNATTSFRLERLTDLIEDMERVLSDPGTIWRECRPQTGQQKRR